MRMGFFDYFMVKTIGRSGGLALMWKEEGQAKIYSYSKNHISVWIEDCNINTKWMLTGFYVELDASKRRKQWELL